MHGIFTLVYVAIAAGAAISAWIVGVRMRRRIHRALGRKATDMELTSINTWFEVEDAEQKQRGYTHSKPIGPKYH